MTIAEIIEGVEDQVCHHLNRTSLTELEDENTHDIPAGLKVAIKSLAATYYSNREALSYGEAKKVPYTYEYCLQPYRSYEKKNS